ncbi:MAG: hypothetical protein ACR2RE_06780 [Geminicoccaceae bacterium]
MPVPQSDYVAAWNHILASFAQATEKAKVDKRDALTIMEGRANARGETGRRLRAAFRICMLADAEAALMYPPSLEEQARQFREIIRRRNMADCDPDEMGEAEMNARLDAWASLEPSRHPPNPKPR